MRGELKKIKKQRAQRARRSHARVRGTSERPRLSVFRSNRHVYAQLIDDTIGKTIVSASTIADEQKKNKTTQSTNVGEQLAKKAKEKGIEKIVFDRGSYKYHGRVKAVAEGARTAGLIF